MIIMVWWKRKTSSQKLETMYLTCTGGFLASTFLNVYIKNLYGFGASLLGLFFGLGLVLGIRIARGAMKKESLAITSKEASG